MCKRVQYKNSPLLEVIFQLQFPTILSINSNEPAEFQEAIRERYPFYEENIEQQNEVTVVPGGNSAQVKQTQTKNHTFISVDKTYKVNLTSSFIAISTVRYTRWEDFVEHINYVIPKFERKYSPAFYTRVGLRYIDAITRGNLGLTGKKWSELIKPHILGIITPGIEENVQTFLSTAEYKNPDEKSFTRVRIELVHVNENKELSLLLDSDYFTTEITQQDSVLSVAETLHTNSSTFIESAIMPDLRNAMEPTEI